MPKFNEAVAEVRVYGVADPAPTWLTVPIDDLDDFNYVLVCAQGGRTLRDLINALTGAKGKGE